MISEIVAWDETFLSSKCVHAGRATQRRDRSADEGAADDKPLFGWLVLQTEVRREVQKCSPDHPSVIPAIGCEKRKRNYV
jgi:hypothetical protein